MIANNSAERHVLRSFYERLKENVAFERGKSRLVEDSIILTLLKTQGKTRDRLVRKSRLSSIEVSPDGIAKLLEIGAIQSTGSFDSYVITAKGVWLFEQDLGVLNEDRLFSYITRKYFAIEKNLPKNKIDLDDKERVILLSMVAARAFSKDSAADLKRSEETKDKWRDILCRSYDLLKEMDLIQKEKRSTFSDSTGKEQHIAAYHFRHNNKMPRKTQSIYRPNGDYAYYLDLYNVNGFAQDKLSYLLWKIFNGNISNDWIEKIVAYCNEIASKEKIFLFDVSKHMFGKPNYDRILKDCLIDSIRNSEKWSKM